jgi:hypothetical protein
MTQEDLDKMKETAKFEISYHEKKLLAAQLTLKGLNEITSIQTVITDSPHLELEVSAEAVNA